MPGYYYVEAASKSPRLEGVEDLMRGSPMNSRICQTDAASPAEPTDLLNGLASIGHLCLVSLTIFHDGDYPTMDIQEGSRTGAPLRSSCMVSSRRWRKRDRSRFSKGAGPPVIVPSSRRWASNARLASASPIESRVKISPRRPITRAPFSRQRAAKGMSPEITMSLEAACSTIQLSAASNCPSTTTSLIQSPLGI